MEEFERGVLEIYPMKFRGGPGLGQRRSNDPLSPEWLFTVLVEVLLARLAKEVFANSLLQRPPALLTLAVDAHQVALVVVEILIQKLWDDVRVSELVVLVAESAAGHRDET